MAWSGQNIEDLQVLLGRLNKGVPGYQTDAAMVVLELMRWVG